MPKNVRIYGNPVRGTHGEYPANTVICLNDKEADMIVASALAEYTDAPLQIDHSSPEEEKVEAEAQEIENMENGEGGSEEGDSSEFLTDTVNEPLVQE
jgi:hypothetical protein